MAHVAVPALERALRLLITLARSSDPPTLAELSGSIGVPRSTVYRLLATLQDHGFVEKDARHKTYRLGIATLELGAAYLNKVDLVQSFDEVAKRLVARCQETVKLAVLDGRDVVYLGRQQGPHSVQLIARVGGRMPAHATAASKVLLAAFDDAEIERLYSGQELRALAANTATDLPTLLARVGLARADGLAYDEVESNPGAYCVAAPVRDHDGRTVAAMSIGLPRDRYSAERMADLAALLVEHAQALSRALGWHG